MAKKQSDTKSRKRPAIPVPKDIHEANQAIVKIAALEGTLAETKREFDERVAEFQDVYINRSRTMEEQIDTLMEGLHAFAEAHRKELTKDGKKKTATLPNGTMSWRMTPPSVSVKNKDAVLAKLKELRLKKFIRVKEDVDKKAMLKEPDLALSVDGVSIDQHEEFVVKPKGMDSELTISEKGQRTKRVVEEKKK